MSESEAKRLEQNMNKTKRVVSVLVSISLAFQS